MISRHPSSTSASRATATTRRLRRFGLLAAVAMTVVACGSSDSGGSAATQFPATEAPDATSGAYPVVVEHRWGSTTIDARPKRIVSMTQQWTDALLALGEQPAAYVLSSAEGARSLFPWQEGLLDSSQAIETTEALAFEAVAAARPDLILVSFAVQDQASYDKLSAIAPTIPLLGTVQIDAWPDQVEVLGRVLDARDKASELIAQVDADVDAIAERLPNLKGAEYSVANIVPGTGIVVLADPNDGAAKLFGRLGLSIDPDFLALDATSTGRPQISFEQIGMLDADFLGVLLNGAAPSDITGLEALPAFVNGTAIEVVFADAVAFNTPSPLSVPYIVNKMLPTFERLDALRSGS